MVAQAGLTSGRYDKILHFFPEYKGHLPRCSTDSVHGYGLQNRGRESVLISLLLPWEDVLLCCGCIFQVARDNLMISTSTDQTISVLCHLFLYSLPLQLVSDNGP